MPTPLKVEDQLFEFGDQWTVAFKYDDTTFYRESVEHKLDETQAVDVIALGTFMLLLLEAKDFRGYRIANKGKLKGPIADVVARKARDTVAGLLGASRLPVNEFASELLAEGLRHGKDVAVVLWLEDDTFSDVRTAKAKLQALNGVLKQRLAWLNVRTLVLSSSVPNKINHLTVTNLPGAGQPNP
jgi:hypothetical protein